MLDKNFTSKEWERLWDNLDSKAAPTFHDRTETLAKTEHFKKSDFGIGAMMMGQFADPIAGFQAEIRGGAGHIEFSTAAMGGGGGNMDFSKIGKERREALKELAKVNKATIHTHAHPGITGMSGFDERQGGFSDESVEFGKQEVRKAIEFAADIEQGGPITFHAGEFTRPLQGQDMGAEFQMSDRELDKLQLNIVDNEKGQVMQTGIVIGESISAPVFDYDKDPIVVEGKNKNYYSPGLYTNDTGEPKFNEYNNFKEYTASLIESKNKKFLEIAEERGWKLESLKKKFKKNDKGINEISDYEVLEVAALTKIREDQQVKILESASQQFNQINRQSAELIKVRKEIEKAEKGLKEGKDNKYFLIKDAQTRRQFKLMTEAQYRDNKDRIGLDEDDVVEISNTSDYKNQKVETLYSEFKIKDVQNQIHQTEVNQLNIEAQINEQQKKIQKGFDTISHHALTKATGNYADLAMEAYEKNQVMKKKVKNFNDIYLTVENLFPEKYGSSPTELLNIIQSSRKVLAERLQDQKKMSAKEAEKVAADTLKTTFDTGHLHMWRKYFRHKPGESAEVRDKKFNKWALAETKKLLDANVIGNIHIADNFGYGDDHLAAGQGIVPLKEYMELFDKAKGDGRYTGKIAVEGGFDEQQSGVHEAWKQSGAEVFRQQSATDAWINPDDNLGSTYQFHQMQDSYLGSGHKPYFVFGRYAPDQQEWAPWSELGLE
jgi:hypothetical protein